MLVWTMFKLHPQLKNDLIPIGKFSLSQLFLLPDSDNPWVVLVPEVEATKEWHHLSIEAQTSLQSEINLVSEFFEKKFTPDKINIGSLGNMVPQLHIHIIGRFKDDKAWPGAIWGTKAGSDQEILAKWCQLLKSEFFPC